jgi:hypothetical protein
MAITVITEIEMTIIKKMIIEKAEVIIRLQSQGVDPKVPRGISEREDLDLTHPVLQEEATQRNVEDINPGRTLRGRKREM